MEQKASANDKHLFSLVTNMLVQILPLFKQIKLSDELLVMRHFCIQSYSFWQFIVQPQTSIKQLVK